MTRYNQAVRKSILLQDMTVAVNEENNELNNKWDELTSLQFDMDNDEAVSLFMFAEKLIRSHVNYANKTRHALNKFFDESGELDVESYELFPEFVNPSFDYDDDDNVSHETSDDDSEMNQEFVHEIHDEDIEVVDDNVESDINAFVSDDTSLADADIESGEELPFETEENLPYEDGYDEVIEDENIPDDLDTDDFESEIKQEDVKHNVESNAEILDHLIDEFPF